MKTTFIKIQTKDNLDLPGLLFEPDQRVDKVLIYLHGMMSSIFYSYEKILTYAQILTNNGISFLAFNNRGSGWIQSIKRKINETDYERILTGSAYEIIKDCIIDIDASINFFQKYKSYKHFYLAGHSTGANKVCVYNNYKKVNKFEKYILLAGGDDTGGMFKILGEKKFYKALEKTKDEIKKGNAKKLCSKNILQPQLSYDSLYDIINPDGDYNVFPFYEVIFQKKISNKPLFRYYKAIQKNTYVIYGQNDDFLYQKTEECLQILKKYTKDKNNFVYKVLENADHGFYGYEKEVAQLIVKFINE